MFCAYCHIVAASWKTQGFDAGLSAEFAISGALKRRLP